jgi:hypothetical protein
MSSINFPNTGKVKRLEGGEDTPSFDLLQAEEEID